MKYISLFVFELRGSFIRIPRGLTAWVRILEQQFDLGYKNINRTTEEQERTLNTRTCSTFNAIHIVPNNN